VDSIQFHLKIALICTKPICLAQEHMEIAGSFKNKSKMQTV